MWMQQGQKSSFMDAQELYALILVQYPKTGEYQVCDLHKPCAESRKCSSSASSRFINFDEVKIEVDKGNKNKNRASVDAITVSGNKFCFVEIKGWMEYLKHNKPKEEKIKKQASSYNLYEKFRASEDICAEIAKHSELFREIPEVFVLVTDIDVNTNGIESFQHNLLALSETGSDWMSLCNESLNYELNKQITSVPKYYIDCRHLEKAMKEIENL